ncbi:putrescine transporter subunit: ATP-binding component of ABC superfamily [Burkholderiales bacterium]|nr:putrescine transporter subunit: ATP-binding component of ABC superfamily [Burkholderiales bacterium]
MTAAASAAAAQDVLPGSQYAADDAHFLRVQRLTKRFGEVAAVDDVSISIGKGEIFALLGSSGCGKSTLLRMLAGFETPSSGEIFLEGEEISGLRPFERPINMMFQSYALFPHLNVWENVAFGLKRHGQSREQIATQVERMLSLVQLKPFVQRKPHQLSGGQQQRVALARSLALEPRLLLLDEPLGALDRKLRAQTQFELHSIIKSVGVTCVLVTHDQEEAMTMADRIAVMSAGRLVQVGAPREIYETPATRFVADFIGTVNLFDGMLVEDEADHCVIEAPAGRFFVGHGITGVKGQRLSVALRPEKIEIATRAPEGTQYNCLQGRVVESAYFGASSLYRVALADGTRLQVSVPNSERHGEVIAVGTEVFASCRPESLVVLVN